MTNTNYLTSSLHDVYRRHKEVHIFFSGGKDSTVVLLHALHLGYGPRTHVVYVNTGAMHQSVIDFIESFNGRVASIERIQSFQPDFVKENGMPTDVVPIFYTKDGELLKHTKSGGNLLCSSFDCCMRNLWLPMYNWCNEHTEVTAMLNGQRDNDLAGCMKSSITRADGTEIEQVFPAREMTTEDIRGYLKKCHECCTLSGELKPRFAMRNGSSLDCTDCTGHWEDLKDRLDFFRVYDESAYTVLSEKVAKVKQLVCGSTAVIESI